MFIGERPTIGDSMLIVLARWNQIRAWTDKLMQVDVVSGGS